MGSRVQLEAWLDKLVVRLKHVQDGKQLETTVQIIQDLLLLTSLGSGAELFEEKQVHIPLMVVLTSYVDIPRVQQTGLSLLCRLIDICPGTLQKLADPLAVQSEWDVLAVHQHVLKVLAIHSGHCKMMMAGLESFLHILRSDVILQLVLEEEIDVFDLVVNAMTLFNLNVDIQTNGFRCLQRLLDRVSHEYLVEFVERGDHEVILAAARVFWDNEEVLVHAMRALLPLATPDVNVELLMSGNARCYMFINQAMESFPSNQQLQEVGCSLFHKFASESYYSILVRNGVHKVIVRACETHSENAVLQASALSCLADLTAMVVLSEALEESQEEGARWINSCFTALELHTASGEVQEAACRALNNLLLHDQQLQRGLSDADGRTPIHRQIMAAMLLHSSSARVFHATTSLLATLMDYNGKIRAQLLCHGIHINIVEMMKKHSSSPEVAEDACKLLHKLFHGRTASLDEGTMTMSHILKAMKDHKFNLQVQLEALRASLTFLNPDMSLREYGTSVADPDNVDVSLKVLKNQCVVEGAHAVYLEALNRFIGHPQVQECGLKVLSAIVDCSGAVDLMCQQGAIDTALHTLQMFPTEREIQYWGLNVLQHLICKKKMSSTMVPVLASVLVKSLKQYSEDGEVHLKAFLVLWKLLDSCSEAAYVLQREEFDRVVFQQLKSKQLSSPLHKISCLCLSRMAAEPGIAYAMLEKACEDRDVDMAECLIKLGADINRRTKTESLIYQVCERGAPLDLVDILLNNGVHEQNQRRALSASVQRRDGPLVSLLLGKLGVDANNNALCLGGFRLGRMESCWLRPLFSDRRFHCFSRRSSRGASLARHIMRLQSRRSALSSLQSYMGSSGYVSDESDDLSVFTLDNSYVFAYDDVESDGSDSVPLGKSRHVWDSGRIRRTSLEEANGDSAFTDLRQQRPSTRRGSFSPVLGGWDSPSPLGTDREHIRLVDLSGNELDSLCWLVEDGSGMQQHLEHVVRLELAQNNLTAFPEQLCECLGSVTRLDLHGNQLQSLPAGLLSLPSLSVLNVSHNRIVSPLCVPAGTMCPSLRQLNLSFNSITVFLSLLCPALEKLEELHLEGNCLTELMSPLCLPELKLLDVSRNSIQKIDSDFLSGCSKLETLNVSTNKLSCLAVVPSRITTLKLSYNLFTSVPDVLLQLPALRSLDMSNNGVEVLPQPSAWASINLRELIFSHNHISVLDLTQPVTKWSQLEKLHLCKNLLTEIPGEIGLLTALTSLDVSRNAALRSFPNEMGKLSRLWDLPLDELRLNLDLKHIGSKTKDIVRFLQQRLKNAVPYYRMKLIVLGNSGSGKTTLIQQLMKLRRPRCRLDSAKTGIRVRDWPIRERDRRNMVLNVWDFSGGEKYNGSHLHFLTQRAMYLVVYNLSKGAVEVDNMKPWLFNIKATAALAPVLLVGTHADESEESHLQQCGDKIREELLGHPSFPMIRDCHVLNAGQESESLSKLRKAIIREAMSFKVQGQPVMGQRVPESYLELEKRILQERVRVPPEFPVMRRQHLLDIVQENVLQLDQAELSHAVHFLSEAGVLLHFDDPALQLSDLYFIEPQWLCNIVSQVITLKNPEGMVQRSVVEKFLLESKYFPRQYLTQYFKLLEKFQIVLPFGDEQLLIPSSLSEQRPVIDLPHCENSEVIIRLYEMPYFPMGLWTRLISRLLEVSSVLLCGKEPGVRPNRIYWRRGIYLSWSPEAYSLVESDSQENVSQSFVKITVPSSRKGRVLLGQLVDHMDSLLEEWFPGLLTTDIHGNGEMLLKKWALYSYEDGQEWRKVLLEDLLTHMSEDGLLVNPCDRRCSVPVSQICPDVVLSDQPASVILASEQLEMDLSKEYLIGDGGFGSVYRAVYKNEDVAVKVFSKHASPTNIHRLMRQELVVLSRLRHPSLVCLLAAGTSPHILVMELAPRGSLDSLFQHNNGSLNRKLQHRIALHVADGLRYLHSCMIIYRDLKPHNILLFNLKADSEVIAKITDYGIAQYCCSMGVRTTEGTPGFRAPEVARGNVIYNQQADVYSFGLLMYDLLTCGERISDGMKFPSECDEVAVQGKLPDPVRHYGCPPWPRFQEVMKLCLKENPQERPTSAQLYDRLCCEELLCLMRDVSLRGSPNAECFTVASGRGEGHVCVAGGSKGHRRGSVTSYTLGPGTIRCQEVGSSPILCLVSVPGESCDWLVAGALSGSLSVISTEDLCVRHNLQSVCDAVTSLFFHSHPPQSKRKNHLLVGAADGTLTVYEESAIQQENGAPKKTVSIGNISTPLVCLGPSSHSLDRSTLWAACGSRVISFTADYHVWRTVETNIHQDEANVRRLVVEKQIYVSRTGAHTVEIWDKKSERMIHLLDCAHTLRMSAKREEEHSSSSSYACVKALLVQQSSGTLWVGTRGGHVILFDLSTRQALKVLWQACESVRFMASVHCETLKPRNAVMVLGWRRSRAQPGEESVLMLWDGTLPLETRDLQQHCHMRERIAEKMRELPFD